MNKTLRNTLITAAAIAACTIGTKANASVVMHLDDGITVYKNDGIPTVVVTDGQEMRCLKGSDFGWPAAGSRGAVEKHRQVQGDRNEASGLLYGFGRDENLKAAYVDQRGANFGHNALVDACQF